MDKHYLVFVKGDPAIQSPWNSSRITACVLDWCFSINTEQVVYQEQIKPTLTLYGTAFIRLQYLVACCHIDLNDLGRYWLSAWWCHQMETFSALLVLCDGNPPVTSGFPSQRPVTRSFDVFFDLCLIKRLNKQSRRRWFETPARSLWRHCNVGTFDEDIHPARLSV